MWVIKIYFEDGSKYTGYTNKKFYFKSTATRQLIRDFRAFPPSNKNKRGKGVYEVFYCAYREHRI